MKMNPKQQLCVVSLNNHFNQFISLYLYQFESNFISLSCIVSAYSAKGFAMP